MDAVEFTIVTVCADRLNVNGDSENASVLARRIEWSGHPTHTRDLTAGIAAPDTVDLIVVGSGTDASLVSSRDVLREFAEPLRRWVTAGAPLLAVGTGWELLSWGVDMDSGEAIEGIGLVAGRAVPRGIRVRGDLVARSPWGELVGFENHARDYVGAEASIIGRVRHGEGNGRASGQEGLRMGEVYGTHLHGPVLAKNPAFADHLIEQAFDRRGLTYTRGPAADRADEFARGARARTLRSLGLSER